eukprot:scaffold2275_cov51-Isochrysis_galbana.AAC.1
MPCRGGLRGGAIPRGGRGGALPWGALARAAPRSAPLRYTQFPRRRRPDSDASPAAFPAACFLRRRVGAIFRPHRRGTIFGPDRRRRV